MREGRGDFDDSIDAKASLLMRSASRCATRDGLEQERLSEEPSAHGVFNSWDTLR